MAESFETLGAGNGFSSCLEKIIPGDKTLLNPPSLEQTMQAYWNFDSVTFGGATFNPSNEPKDLICNSDDNVGSASDGDSRPGYPGEFTVTNSLPTIFFIDGVKYYKHGISMTFSASNSQTLSPDGQQESSISVQYLSSLYNDLSNLNKAYTCVNITFEEEVIGKSSSEFNQTVSSVTISGIPFIKIVTKSFGGENVIAESGDPIPPCPSPSYPAEPGTPTLNFHTY
tara:strand:- start:30 stop:710 length:681 start_codon:yes stop_codon:yes gene_type:complete